MQGVRGLHDFHARPAKRTLTKPAYTSSKGNHYLAPDDFATLYNLTPLYKAGITGAGQNMVVAGQTQINLSDIQAFRTEYGLPANDPQVMLIPGSRDPGISKDDLPEADLDLEWSGAVARNATIIFVYSDDVMSSVQYAIDQNLAPVVSTSYGLCEAETSSFDMQAMRSWAQQGNAQGITWVASSGDSGGADCDDPNNPGLAVDTPASIPEVTGIGGTEFSEGSGIYWGTNGSTKASALSYIPETTWNDSVADGEPSAGGGGASTIFAKPAWQTGPGVPNDNARHVPDISFTASADHDGYLVYTSATDEVYGGTSVPAPSFAGVTVLLNQYLIQTGAQAAAGLGNLNPKLYTLAQSNPAAFHDVTTGDNIVTVACSKRRTNCSTTPVGFSAGAGYDQATGLGSVDVAALAAAWSGQAPTQPPVTTPSSRYRLSLLSSVTAPSAGDVVFMIATVTSTDGVTPSGVVTFEAGGKILGSALLTGSAGTATATVTVQVSQLPSGSAVVTATYGQSASASVTVSVTGAVPGPVPSIAAMVNGASLASGFAPGEIMTVFGSQLAVSASIASSVPLPVSMAGVAATVNGVAAPLYYVSPSQMNLQIPYETAAGNGSHAGDQQQRSSDVAILPGGDGRAWYLHGRLRRTGSEHQRLGGPDCDSLRDRNGHGLARNLHGRGAGARRTGVVPAPTGDDSRDGNGGRQDGGGAVCRNPARRSGSGADQLPDSLRARAGTSTGGRVDGRHRQSGGNDHDYELRTAFSFRRGLVRCGR